MLMEPSGSTYDRIRSRRLLQSAVGGLNPLNLIRSQRQRQQQQQATAFH